MEKLIIMCAPNGARKTKADHPAIPITPEDLAAESARLVEAGVTMLHLHVRDDEEGHTLEVARYQEAIAAIRERVGDKLILQATSEAVGIYRPEEQMAMVEALQPEAVSLALRELAPSEAEEARFGAFLKWLMAEQIIPQYILYSPEEVRRFAKLRKNGLIPGKKVFVLFVLGKKTGNPEAASDPSQSWAKPEDLDPFLEQFEHGLKLQETLWAGCFFGGNEAACAEYAADCGGHIRIGFENNHLLSDGTVAAHNDALIHDVTEQLVDNRHPRMIARVEEVREMLKPCVQIKAA